METTPETTMETPHLQPVKATWALSADSIVTACSATYGEEVLNTILACYRWCVDARHPISRKDFAARVGYDETTVYKFFANKYLHPETRQPQPPPRKFLDNAAEFLRLEEERFLGGSTEFVLTPTAKKIYGFFSNVRESSSMAFMSGPSHIGKTWASENFQQANNHGKTIYCRMHAASGLGGMVRALALACGISDNGNTAALIERIKRGLTRDTLVILDECHLLSNTYRVNSFFACVEVLREIYDATNCGMVLIWTRIDSLKAHSQRELQQVWRRGVHKLVLPEAPTRGDVAAIAKAHGLELPEKGEVVTVKGITETPLDVLRQVSKAEGLKAITERLRYARKLARKAGETLDWAHFVAAHLMIERQSKPEEAGW